DFFLLEQSASCREGSSDKLDMWKNMDVEMLLSLVSEHRELLNKMDEVKAKWKNLRDTRRKREEPWKFMKVMEFLACVFCSVHSNIEECDCELEDGDGSDSEQATCSSGASTTSSEPVQSSSKKRKQPETPDFMERYLAAKEVLHEAEYDHTDIPLSPQQPVSYHRTPPQTPPQYNNSANS
uniref:Uncharacterized protein n=1 Tax=Sinocyclocheilus grahami TaxID=75366 RepID=A0A672JYG0_SINGR